MIDHWDRVGDWSQQWLNLRYVTRFLARVGADDDALTLHRALVDAGKGSPLTAKTRLPASSAGDRRQPDRGRSRGPGTVDAAAVFLKPGNTR